MIPPTYKYAPLDRTKREIRLLSFPRRIGDRMQITSTEQMTALLGLLSTNETAKRGHCRLEKCSLDDEDVDYSALSYCWGAREPSYSLDITNGTKSSDSEEASAETNSRIQISENLKSALDHISREDDFNTYIQEPMVRLWIDAVCINQSDNEEKAWQVQMMREIYQSAAKVIVWLGPKDETSNLAMEVLMGMGRVAKALQPYQGEEKIHRGLDTHSKDINVNMTNVPKDATQDLHPDDLELGAAFGELFGKDTQSGQLRPFPIEAIVDLFDRPYWSRMWVLQEYVSAKEVVIMCGSKCIKGDGDLRTFMATWDHQSWEMGTSPCRIDHRPWTITHTRIDLKNRDALLRAFDSKSMDDDEKKKLKEWMNSHSGKRYFKTLAKLLQESAKADLESADPRDRIYGLIGLAMDWKDLGIEVSYSVPYQKLYTEVARAIYKTGDLGLLTYCIPYGDETPDLPSWAPDWSAGQGLAPIRERRGHTQYGDSPYSASGDLKPDVAFPDDARDILRLGGFYIDTIEELSDPRPNVSQANVSPSSRRAVIQWIFNFTDDLLYEHEGESVYSSREKSEACWRLPVLDQFALPTESYERAGDEARKAYAYMRSESISGLFGGPLLDAGDRRLGEIYFMGVMASTVGQLVPFRTKKGYVGFGKPGVRAGDSVVVFAGLEVPCVIREAGGELYKLVSEAFVQGIMYGEGIKEGQEKEFFDLI